MSKYEREIEEVLNRLVEELVSYSARRDLELKDLHTISVILKNIHALIQSTDKKEAPRLKDLIGGLIEK